METGKRSTPAMPIGRMRGFLRRQVASDRGAALILAIVTLIVLTVIGIAALTRTNVELRVAQGEKAFNVALYNADAATNVTGEVLEQAIFMRNLSAGSYKDSSSRIYVNDPNFWDESMVKEGSTKTWISWPRDYYNDQTDARAYDQAEHNHDEDSSSVDLRLNLPLTSGGSARATASVDVDYLQFALLEGGSLLQSMGYEGLGKGTAGAGAKRVYGFAFRGDGPANTKNRVRVYVTYDHIL
jgi:hypothetical protein